MKNLKSLNKILLIPLVILISVFLISCVISNVNTDNAQESSKDTKHIELTISAAASLKNVMTEIKTAYLKENSNVTITYNFGSSGSLQKQIEQGAMADVFLSAAAKQMDELEDKGLIIEDTRKDFLENKIVLIVPAESSGVTGFKDLLTDKVKRIGLGEPKSVPVGQYGEEVLKKLDIVDLVDSKIVYAKDVKEVLAWVETGNADAGIVYETDTKVSDKVKLVARAPQGSHRPVYYPAAVLKESRNQESAKNFVNFLYSSKAKPIFEKYGFVFME